MPSPVYSNGDILFGSKTNFLRYERAPYNIAVDYVQVTYSDGTFLRTYEVSYNAATGVWLYKYRNFEQPLTYANSTYDNETALLYTETGGSLLAATELRVYNDGY